MNQIKKKVKSSIKTRRTDDNDTDPLRISSPEHFILPSDEMNADLSSSHKHGSHHTTAVLPDASSSHTIGSHKHGSHHTTTVLPDTSSSSRTIDSHHHGLQCDSYHTTVALLDALSSSHIAEHAMVEISFTARLPATVFATIVSDQRLATSQLQIASQQCDVVAPRIAPTYGNFKGTVVVGAYNLN